MVEGDSPSNSLTYIEILPTSSTSCTSLLFRGENRLSCSLLGEGVGEGVTGNCPRALSGGSVKDGRGGDEFMIANSSSIKNPLLTVYRQVKEGRAVTSRIGSRFQMGLHEL
jgi:hypothetical protein